MKILIGIIAYLIGNISTAFLVGKLFANIDIRKHGSGNAGATNVLRTLGVKAAALTFIGDSLKGVLAVMVGRMMGGMDGAILAGIFVVIGHNWPVFLKFKGGKGIATSIGAVLMINPLSVLISAGIGIAFLAKTKYVSLASITGMLVLPLAMAITLQPFKLIMFSVILTVMALIRHSGNIDRLLRGTENKLGQKNKS